MKNAPVYLVIWLLLTAPVGLLSQPPTKPANPADPKGPAQTLVPLEPTKRSRLLSSAWSSGKLPAPMTSPRIDGEDQAGAIVMQNVQHAKAAAFATSIAGGDESSMPAVVGAMLQAGFAISNADGTKQQWTGRQGLAIPDYQIAAMAKQYGQGQSVSIKSFISGFQRTFKPLPRHRVRGYAARRDPRERREWRA